MLRIENLSVGPLTNIQFNVAEGECLPVQGPSGSGKTCLFRAVADLMPHKGEIWLRGKLQSDMPAWEWRKQVQLVPAASQWWFSECGQHFLSKPDAETLQGLGLELPLMNQATHRLSSGQKQRLALLRALQFTPVVLLLDEPTANLDPDNARRFREAVQRYLRHHQACALWITHDEQMAAQLNERRVIISAQGQCQILTEEVLSL